MHSMFRTLSLFWIVTLLSAATAHAQGGEHSGGGGNRVLQFKNIAYELVELLDGAGKIPVEIARINLKKLKRAIDETTVEVTDEILRPSPNGRPESAVIVDAINTPSRKRIRFNKEDWDHFPSGSKRTALVLHEYLGILHAKKVPYSDDSHFQISHHIYDLPALKLWFDNSEVAQALDDIEFDFPVSCSYQYRDQAVVQIGMLGQYYSFGNVETHSCLRTRDVAEDLKTKQKLRILIYDESDETTAMILEQPPSKKAALRFMVGWTSASLYFDQAPHFNQSMKLSTNFQFETTLDSLNLRIECHRVRMNQLKKP